MYFLSGQGLASAAASGVSPGDHRFESNTQSELLSMTAKSETCCICNQRIIKRGHGRLVCLTETDRGNDMHHVTAVVLALSRLPSRHTFVDRHGSFSLCDLTTSNPQQPQSTEQKMLVVTHSSLEQRLRLSQPPEVHAPPHSLDAQQLLPAPAATSAQHCTAAAAPRAATAALQHRQQQLSPTARVTRQP